MKNSVFFVACLLSVNICSSSKLPSNFKKCDRKQADFNQCLKISVEDAIRQLNNSIKEVGLSSLEPLEIPSLTIGAGTGPVGLQQNFKDVKVSGFSKLECTKLDMNFDKKSLHFECTFPEIKMVFQYDVNGKILLLPVYGKGPGSLIISKPKFQLTFNLEEYDKKNVKHFKVIDSKLVIAPELIKYNFENLFDGDKALGDNINKVLNENWAEVYADVETSYEDAFAQVFSAIFNNLLGKVPISELFGDV